jgi:hypothetical protein
MDAGSTPYRNVSPTADMDAGSTPYRNVRATANMDAGSTPYRNVRATANMDAGANKHANAAPYSDIHTTPHKDADAALYDDVHTTPHRDTNTRVCHARPNAPARRRRHVDAYRSAGNLLSCTTLRRCAWARTHTISRCGHTDWSWVRLQPHPPQGQTPCPSSRRS